MKSRIVIVIQNAEVHAVLSDEEVVEVEIVDLAYDSDGDARAAAAMGCAVSELLTRATAQGRPTHESDQRQR